jgi:hypothetical protein
MLRRYKETIAVATATGKIRSQASRELRLDSYWDALRGDPRFEKIVASLAPKTAGK